MKRNLSIALMFLAAAGFAAAQIQPPTSDVLGAHLNYGRGCPACHAPHSGAFGNGYVPVKTVVGGVTINDVANTGTVALWGEDVSNLLGQSLTFGNGTVEPLPASVTASTPDVSGVLLCLSCHDGNLATGAMMQNKVYETLPATYGATKPPTLLGNDGTGLGNYTNDHPVGLNAVIGCGGSHNWDCTIDGSGNIIMNGPNSGAFLNNYGFFVSPGKYNNQPVVLCTTCHNQHLMNVVSVKNGVKDTPNTVVGGVITAYGTGSGTGLPSGYYATMFFIRAPYNPNSGTSGSNQTAQFCRQCHGGEANESNGGTTIPTVF